MTEVISSFIQILGVVLVVAILIRALMSWIMPSDSSGLGRVLQDITEPILAPVRRILPPVAGIDFSPILAMIAIQIISSILVSWLNSAG